MYVQCSERLHLGELLKLLEAGLEKTRVFLYKKNPAQRFLCFFLIFAQKSEFRVFSVSRILLGISRL
jgi:hypothetical protein